MTTTTKIFVILVCLFAFVFTPLAISFAARTHNWRALADDYRSELAVAYANERSVMAIAASEIERYKALRDDEHGRLLDLQQQYSQIDRKNADLKDEQAQFTRSHDAWETSASLLTAEMTVKTRHNQELSDAKEKALERERELRVRNLQLNDRVKELDAKLAIITQQLRQKLDEITAYREENEQFRRASGLGQAATPMTSTPSPSAQAQTPAAPSPIHGTVTKVNGALATVDVGSAAGVRKGMRMVVLRSGDYVCDLTITAQITPTEAVGEVLLERDKRIRQGDTVEDADSFSSR